MYCNIGEATLVTDGSTPQRDDGRLRCSNGVGRCRFVNHKTLNIVVDRVGGRVEQFLTLTQTRWTLSMTNQ